MMSFTGSNTVVLVPVGTVASNNVDIIARALERRGEGMVLARWAREALLACRASFADTASFEDTADCVRMWF